MTADNYCFLWDSLNSKMKAKFLLQSPGVNICWHKDEKSKVLLAVKIIFLVYNKNTIYILFQVMVGEKSGLIRIYNVETLKPLFTLMCNGFNSTVSHNPLLSFDWSESNPEVVVGSTINTIVLWNTFNSWY